MKMTRWNILNAENEIIKTVCTTYNNRAVAINKLKARLPELHYFCRLEIKEHFDVEGWKMPSE